MSVVEESEHKWQFGQEHQDNTLYKRFHRDVYLPDYILAAARSFIPDKRAELPLSDHYKKTMKERGLPELIRMPNRFDIVDVTIVRAADVIFRVLIRIPWGKRVDLALVLEGDGEIVTGFFIKTKDNHATLDMGAYETEPKQSQ